MGSITTILCLMVAILAAALLGLSLGVFSARSPEQSIGFYQSIMKKFNWRVVPVDAEKERRNTRRLGIFLIVSSLVLVLMIVFDFFVLLDVMRYF